VPRIRSLVETVEITVAKKAHDCQGNSGHRIVRGDRRLAVKEGRGWEHYCIACGRRMLERDAAKIAGLLRAIDLGVVLEGAAAPGP
jgi:hypothetical protein